MPVNSVNLQLMQHYKRPKYAVSLLLTVRVCYQIPAVMTPSRQRTTSSVYVLWLRRAAPTPDFRTQVTGSDDNEMF